MKWTEEARKAYEKMQEIRFTDPKTVIALGRKLLKEALEQKSSHVMGLANFAIGDAYYTLCDRDNCIIYLHHAIQCLSKTEDYEKLGECYNLLGMLFAHQGDNSSAFDNFAAGMDILEEHPDLNFLGVAIYENYSELCDRTGNTEEARKKVLISLDYCEKLGTKSDRYLDTKSVVLGELIQLDVRLGKEAEARVRMREFTEIRELLGAGDRYDFADDVTMLLYWEFIGDRAREDEFVQKSLQSLKDCTYRIDFFWTAIHFLEYLKRKGRDDLEEEVVNLVDESLSGDEFPDLKARLCRYRVEILEKRGETGALIPEMRHFMNFVTKKQQVENHTVSLLMQMQETIHRSKTANLMLERRANTDPLTGISNRGRYNDVADRSFEECYYAGRLFGLEMMDIDHFKEVNDTYGHRTGDDCLKVVADVLRNIENDKVSVFRYGGDEFTVLYQDMDRAAIGAVCAKIRSDLAGQLEGTYLPHFTVSQGVCCAVPKDGNRIWDFASSADETMYQVKRSGGDSSIVTDGFAN